MTPSKKLAISESTSSGIDDDFGRGLSVITAEIGSAQKDRRAPSAAAHEMMICVMHDDDELLLLLLLLLLGSCI